MFISFLQQKLELFIKIEAVSFLISIIVAIILVITLIIWVPPWLIFGVRVVWTVFGVRIVWIIFPILIPLLLLGLLRLFALLRLFLFLFWFFLYRLLLFCDRLLLFCNRLLLFCARLFFSSRVFFSIISTWVLLLTILSLPTYSIRIITSSVRAITSIRRIWPIRVPRWVVTTRSETLFTRWGSLTLLSRRLQSKCSPITRPFSLNNLKSTLVVWFWCRVCRTTWTGILTRFSVKFGVFLFIGVIILWRILAYNWITTWICWFLDNVECTVAPAFAIRFSFTSFFFTYVTMNWCRKA